MPACPGSMTKHQRLGSWNNRSHFVLEAEVPHQNPIGVQVLVNSLPDLNAATFSCVLRKRERGGREFPGVSSYKGSTPRTSLNLLLGGPISKKATLGLHFNIGLWRGAQMFRPQQKGLTSHSLLEPGLGKGPGDRGDEGLLLLSHFSRVRLCVIP